MQLHLNKLPRHTFRTVFQRLGYHPDANLKSGDESYSRRLNGNTYPRYHVYINPQADSSVVVNLHLDMKRPSYAGSHAHSAEYDGDLVSSEMRRLAAVLQSS